MTRIVLEQDIDGSRHVLDERPASANTTEPDPHYVVDGHRFEVVSFSEMVQGEGDTEIHALVVPTEPDTLSRAE